MAAETLIGHQRAAVFDAVWPLDHQCERRSGGDAARVAQQRSHVHGFAAAVDAALGIDKRIEPGRQVPAGLDAFVYTERGVYRSGETVHVTSLLRDARAQLSVDGHFLYGAPASNLDLQGTVTIAAAKERPGFTGYSFGLADDEVTAARQDIEDLPATDATGKASFPVKLDKIPATSRPLEAHITVSMAESGGRAVERKLTLPIAPDAAMIGVKPAFSGRTLADGANADFDVVMVAPDGGKLAKSGLRYELLKVDTSYQWYRQNG